MSTEDLPNIIIKPRRALPFFSRHPWVFAGAIGKYAKKLEVGTEVLVVSNEGKPIARGLFNPASQIKIRLYSWDVNRPLDKEFWKERMESAIALRRSIFSDDASFNACRLIFSEADDLSGLTVDRFGDWLAVQFTSAAMAKRSEEICDLLEELLQPKGIWLRTEKGMSAAEGMNLSDRLLRGESPPRPLFIEENGLSYGVDLCEGQKTGFYYDQRDNRLAAARYLQGDVLDVCCYTGGFSLNALKHGRTKHVTGVDSSAASLKIAEQNAVLNDLSIHCKFEHCDALKYLDACETKYDGIILDPPKFARSRGGIQRAAKAYLKWNIAAINLLNPGSTLVTCSCSGLISREDFEEIIAKAAIESNRKLRILESRGQASDHPVATTCPENAYLKCLICAVE